MAVSCGRFPQFCRIYLCRAKAVVTQDLAWRIRIHQHERGADIFAAMLLREASQVIVEFRNTAIETAAVMYTDIECAFLKHGGLSAVPPSVPATGARSVRKAR